MFPILLLNMDMACDGSLVLEPESRWDLSYDERMQELGWMYDPLSLLGKCSVLMLGKTNLIICFWKGNIPKKMIEIFF